MGAPVSTEEIFQVLQAALQPDQVVRTRAEQYICEAYCRPGCAVALLQIVGESQVDTGLRQLAAVLLKQQINRHWDASEQGFVEPELSDAEKGAVRPQLLQTIFQVPHTVSTPLGVCAATIANWDFPEVWPEVLPFLLEAIRHAQEGGEGSQQQQQVAMRTLRLMAEDMSDTHLPSVLQAVLPQLLAGMADGSTRGLTLRLALAVVAACVKSMPMMVDAVRKQLRRVLRESLPQLLEALGRILTAPVPQADPLDWAARQEALVILQELLTCLGKAAAPHVPAAMSCAWHFCDAAAPVYQAVVVQGHEAVATDVEGVDFETVVEQLLEFFLTLLGARDAATGKTHGAMLHSVLDRLLHHTLTFMQMTAAQEESWGSDANQYVAEEDVDAFGARSSCEMLLAELQTQLHEKLSAAMTAVVQQRLAHAAQQRSRGEASWWRQREAALYAIGTLIAAADDDSGSGVPHGLDAPAVLRDVLAHDLEGADVPPFLRGRALWVAAKLGGALPNAEAAAFLGPITAGLGPEVPLPVRIGACRAVARLFGLVGPEQSAPHLQPVLVALLQLMQTVDEDVLMLVFETTEAVCKVHKESMPAHSAAIAAAVLHLFPSFANDVSLVETAGSLLSQLATVPGSLEAMAQVGTPILLAQLQDASREGGTKGAFKAEGTLDLLCSFISPAHPDVARQIYTAASQIVCHLLLHSNEPNVTQSCCDVLRNFIAAGGAGMLQWGGASKVQTLELLSQIFGYLLAPDTEDAAAQSVAGLVLQALLSFSHEAPEMAPRLLQLLAAKCIACELGSLRGQLLVVITRILVEQDADSALRTLAECPVPPGAGQALPAFFDCWMDHAMDTTGEFQLRLCALAIARLLSSKHAALQQIEVKGKPQVSSSGVRTRRQAAAAGPAMRHKLIPLPVKLMHVVVQVLQEAEHTAQDAGKEWRDLLYGEENSAEDDSDYDSSTEDSALGLEVVVRAHDHTM